MSGARGQLNGIESKLVEGAAFKLKRPWEGRKDRRATWRIVRTPRPGWPLGGAAPPYTTSNVTTEVGE